MSYEPPTTPANLPTEIVTTLNESADQEEVEERPVVSGKNLSEEGDFNRAYETQLVRAIEGVLSPLGWDRSKIRQYLSETREPKLTAFANGTQK